MLLIAFVMSLPDELLQVLHGNEDGMSDQDLKRYFGDRYSALVPTINELLAANRIQLFLQGETLFYRLYKITLVRIAINCPCFSGN